MANVPIISITVPEQEEGDDVNPSNTPGSPTVFDLVSDMGDIECQPIDDQVDSFALDADINETTRDLGVGMNDTDNTATRSAPPCLREFYNDRIVLITGATGFIGTVVLWKLLQSLHREIEGVMLLIRPNRKYKTAMQRFQEEILTSKAFVSLRQTIGTSAFDTLVQDKIWPVSGDLTLPGLGLTETDRDAVQKVNVILHCAGSVEGVDFLESCINTNAIGTINLYNVAHTCSSLASFVHLSPLNFRGTMVLEDHLSPMPDDVFTHHNLSFKDSLEVLEGIRQKLKYPNAYVFSKALAEHLLILEVEKNQTRGTPQIPLAIMRLSPVGPSLLEPLIGWTADVNGANGILLLTGQGARLIPPQSGDNTADILPVDYVARLILCCAATTTTPSTDFKLPIADAPDYTNSADIPMNSTSDTIEPIRDSGTSEGVSTYRSSAASQTSSHTSVPTEIDSVTRFPSIYHATTMRLRPINWFTAYEAIRQYWTKATDAPLPRAQSYFGTTGANSLSRAATMISTMRSAVSIYMSGRSSASSTDSTRTSNGKRGSAHLRRCVEKASRCDSMLKSTVAIGSRSTLEINTTRLRQSMQQDSSCGDLDPTLLVPDSVSAEFWVAYFMNACYGVHHYVALESAVRVPVSVSGWKCILHPLVHAGLDEDPLDRQVQSVIFSSDDIRKRTARMIGECKQLLLDAVHPGKLRETQWQQDLDDCLEDWCNDETCLDKEKRIMALGKWRRKMGSNDDSIKVVVLNDKRVNHAFDQIIQQAGVSKQTAAGEAMRILMRMSERTQLSYVWFAGAFLKSMLEEMFDTILVRPDMIRQLRETTQGKRVVYVPVWKSTLDFLIVWYLAIRYNLPVPAIACDEAMANLGAISDLYRLAGAYYVIRDPTQRTALNSAVMAAYTQVLLREHGALALSLERTRTRTGKLQEPFRDGLVEMIVESAIQTNQSSTTPSPKHSVDVTNSSPTSPVFLDSPTSSVGSSKGSSKMRDVLFVPIHITYEKVPELASLIDEVLDHHLPTTSKRTHLAPVPQAEMARPSQAAADRRQGEGMKKHGRVLVGMGEPISVQAAVEACNTSSDPLRTKNHMSPRNTALANMTQEQRVADYVVHTIQANQRKALVISPTSILAAIILYGRATGGVCFAKVKELAGWIGRHCQSQGFQVDWEEGEDQNLMVFYLRQFKENQLVMDYGKEIHDDCNIRLNDHADHVMTLSYYANQLVDAFLLEAFFSVIYLSFTDDVVPEDEFKDRFVFLVQMLEREFVLSWDIDTQLDSILSHYEQLKVVRRTSPEVGSPKLTLSIKMESHPVQYEQLMFLASLVYPTIDTYWITSCSLSALEAVPMLPYKIVPLLSQWIATHLISGRRTIYREVLSTESSKLAVKVFITMGFLTEIQAKEKLSPDTQSLLHELGIPTAETLIELTGQNSDGGQTLVSPEDPAGLMKALMAQIQMNQANSNMADLCQQINMYRLGAASQHEAFQNTQIFSKCLRQIKGILHSDSSVAKRRHYDLAPAEERLVQLVYALRVNSPHSHRNNPRRISEAYNLR